mgnify:CR=1 FL=1
MCCHSRRTRQALAAEMRLSVVEVFEVASFYHHFQILKDDQTAPVITVRVCNSLSCALAGAETLLAQVQREVGAQVQVLAGFDVASEPVEPMEVVQQLFLPPFPVHFLE